MTISLSFILLYVPTTLFFFQLHGNVPKGAISTISGSFSNGTRNKFVMSTLTLFIGTRKINASCTTVIVSSSVSPCELSNRYSHPSGRYAWNKLRILWYEIGCGDRGIGTFHVTVGYAERSASLVKNSNGVNISGSSTRLEKKVSFAMDWMESPGMTCTFKWLLVVISNGPEDSTSITLV